MNDAGPQGASLRAKSKGVLGAAYGPTEVVPLLQNPRELFPYRVLPQSMHSCQTRCNFQLSLSTICLVRSEHQKQRALALVEMTTRTRRAKQPATLQLIQDAQKAYSAEYMLSANRRTFLKQTAALAGAF